MVELSVISHFVNAVIYHNDLLSSLRYLINALVTWKGKEYTFQEYLGLLRIIDLSSNRLIGDIPMELTNLVELVQLNLSRNNLSGCIPENIGNLSKLEALDFSHNSFTGKIPIGLGEVSFLQYLDLSYNHLSGSIPTGTQLQSFDASSYVGNDKLCGLPLLAECELVRPVFKGDDPHDLDFDDQRWFDMSWFYVGIEVGIALGFIGVCGALYRNSFLLDACLCLGCFNQFGDWLYVVINIRISKLKTYLQS
ncbi:receptor-like protein EIX2 [Cannabis sativa]|uniref:receptor-like protein EIX2 n=1 Tax=Cannabis sativa TaxID=3483 RepID=UPI0029CA6EDC|nr:receptor-like protein EIX2 [Cannabis sativa]